MIATIAELDRVRAECRRLVTTRALMAAGATAVPVPGADMVADLGLLTALLPMISGRFGLDHQQVAKLEPYLARQVLVVASGLGNSVIGRLVTRGLIVRLLQRIGVRVATASVARYVPLIGSVVAAGISFGALKMVGDRHIEDCYETARALIDAAERDDTGGHPPHDLPGGT